MVVKGPRGFRCGGEILGVFAFLALVMGTQNSRAASPGPRISYRVRHCLEGSERDPRHRHESVPTYELKRGLTATEAAWREHEIEKKFVRVLVRTGPAYREAGHIPGHHVHPESADRKMRAERRALRAAN